MMVVERKALGSLLGKSSCELPQKKYVDDVEMALSGRLGEGRKDSARRGLPSSVSSQQNGRSTASTWSMYFQTYSNVPRMLARDCCSSLARDCPSFFSRDRFVLLFLRQPTSDYTPGEFSWSVLIAPHIDGDAVFFSIRR